jgi:hypothetical protein
MNKWIWAAAYLITILLGNIAVDMFGVVKIGWLTFRATGLVGIGWPPPA